MFKIDFEKIQREIEAEKAEKEQLFGTDFQKKFSEYAYLGIGIDSVGNQQHRDKLFNVHGEYVKPIFEFMESETVAEKLRHQNTTYGVYHFNNPESWRPIRIEISAAKKSVPSCLEHMQFRGSKPKFTVDIEFFEKPTLEDDSKNLELKEFIKEYTVNGSLKISDLEELGSLMALQDLEKIHLKFLVFDNNTFIVEYLGIGTNQPFTISEKGDFGKNRYFRYSLEDLFIQTSNVETTGRIITFHPDDLIFPENSTDGQEYALYPDVGIIIRTPKGWKKASIRIDFENLDLSNELTRPKSIQYIKDSLISLFPKFDGYHHVFYDPMERVNSFGHIKAIKLLCKKGILGEGWQSKMNVASDLYENGHSNVFRIKPAALLLFHFIDSSELESIIQTVIDGSALVPIKNQ